MKNMPAGCLMDGFYCSGQILIGTGSICLGVGYDTDTDTDTTRQVGLETGETAPVRSAERTS